MTNTGVYVIVIDAKVKVLIYWANCSYKSERKLKRKLRLPFFDFIKNNDIIYIYQLRKEIKMKEIHGYVFKQSARTNGYFNTRSA